MIKMQLVTSPAHNLGLVLKMTGGGLRLLLGTEAEALKQ